HLLLATAHHIAFDGWSRGVLLRELRELYAAFSEGRPSPLPELPIQYADYAVWQRERLQGAGLASQLAWWRERLAGAPPLLELPADRLRPRVPSFRGEQASARVPAGLADALRVLGREEGATLFMTVLAAFQALLCRWSGQEDVVVGAPVAGRARSETDGLVGCFINTLALRTDLSGDPAFREILGRAREAALGAFAHEEVPFERVVEELRPERSLSYSPVFQVLLNFRNFPRTPAQAGGLGIAALAPDRGVATFDLALEVEEGEDGLVCVLEYAAELFERERMTLLLDHFLALLEQVAADPGVRLSAIRLPGRTDEPGTGAAGPRRAELVHERVAAQAGLTPDAVAVAREGGSLTYAELDLRANRLANHLRRLGVGPEVRVGVCMERSPELVVALLAVLKAGGAYVPLDPGHPPDRLAFVLEDADVAVVLTGGGPAERLPAGGARVVHLDRDRPLIAAESPSAPRVEVAPESLAYVIYTSGSTGRPRGVMVPHAALASHMAWMGRVFPLAPDDRVLQKTPVAFDASVWEFWAPLQAGARLVPAAPGAHRDPPALLREVEEEGITVLQVVPTLLRGLLEACGGERRTGLRRLFCGGEALPAELAARAAAALGAEVVNLYGPTEACIDATFQVRSGAEPGTTVPIGRPVDHVAAYVLDAGGSPVPPGTPGELYLGGAQLARGYLGRPGPTAERWVPDPFGAVPGERLFRTGDRVRRLADGALEFLGRVDHQVKLRGFRIEPGEVEAALREVQGVRDALVAVRVDAAGVERLVAWLEADGGVTVEGVRRRLREQLPEYMVPGAFVLLEALPLTPNGKVDRGALPDPAPDRSAAGAYVAPRTPTEETLAGIWAEVLGVERVGVHDSFFALGGHSLLAMRVVSRVREAVGVELPADAVFDAPTVAEMSALLLRRRAGEDGRDDDLARMLEALEQLSDQEAERLLAEDLPGPL
ncbi:MAG TPA: amino acid adenylation domain-containing protein, partial [Longimicrobiaceae bacterium]|nr:amino acid adenylation domain-containing protein [Longimicrobiaceae bacterium]